jgi:FkbM family methyltransferase
VRVLDVLAYAMRHPLNRARPFAAAWRVVRWQAVTRLRPGTRAVPFVDRSVLRVARGMTGATGNVYCGLHEYAEMGFLLHWLCEGECFVDVGANVGSWWVLAAAACGARVVALEPDANARHGLLENLRANAIEAAVEVHACAAAATRGARWFTQGGDTTNHLLEGEPEGTAMRVEAHTLDALLGTRVVAMAKIDVEGAEREVLAGARGLLARGEPAALVVEFSGPGGGALLRELVACGFQPCAYDPATRLLSRVDPAEPAGNLLLLRDPAAAQARVAAAPRRRIHPSGSWL